MIGRQTGNGGLRDLNVSISTSRGGINYQHEHIVEDRLRPLASKSSIV